ncbi:MAG: queuosine precursor transporter [Candidatus Pacearchaeota archaeon]
MEIFVVLAWIVGMLIIATVSAVLAKKFGPEILVGMFAGAVVITAVIANKIVVFGPFTLSASIIVFSITFFFTDILSEFWGKKKAQKAVWAGFLADVLLLFALWVAIQWEPASFWQNQEAFAKTLGQAPRIVAASLGGYVVAQNYDVWAYHFLKRKTNGKHLWIRNLASTGSSQIIDSVIFATVAFLGKAPVLPVILSTIVVKYIIAALDTPFIYAVRWYYEKVPPKKKSKKVEEGVVAVD